MVVKHEVALFITTIMGWVHIHDVGDAIMKALIWGLVTTLAEKFATQIWTKLKNWRSNRKKDN